MRVELPGIVAIRCDLGKALPHDGPMSGPQIVHRGHSPGAKYSAKFFTAVTFSLKKLLMPDGVLREGSYTSAHLGSPPKMSAELIMAPTTPWVMPWPESPVCT
jgi:hypothetical protein